MRMKIELCDHIITILKDEWHLPRFATSRIPFPKNDDPENLKNLTPITSLPESYKQVTSIIGQIKLPNIIKIYQILTEEQKECRKESTVQRTTGN